VSIKTVTTFFMLTALTGFFKTAPLSILFGPITSFGAAQAIERSGHHENVGSGMSLLTKVSPVILVPTSSC
jgi:hypothetical protein